MYSSELRCLVALAAAFVANATFADNSVDPDVEAMALMSMAVSKCDLNLDRDALRGPLDRASERLGVAPEMAALQAARLRVQYSMHVGRAKKWPVFCENARAGVFELPQGE